MKIDYLKVRSRFKNLSDVFVDFDEQSLMTVVVGRNGSGKSNVLEALVCIFRNLDLGESPPFSYELRYKLGSEDTGIKWITIDADPARGALSKQYQISVSQSEAAADAPSTLPISKVKRNKHGKAEYLPKYIFAYYSGPSDRLENHFKKHRTDFYRRLLKNEIDLKGDIRPLFYAKPSHSQFVLLAFFLAAEGDDERAFLREQMGIEGLDSVHFVMRRPGWARSKQEIFWGADGVVREFLEMLLPHALAPVKVRRNEKTSLTGNNITNEFLHLYLPDIETLHRFAKDLSPDVFFKMLESTLLSEILEEVSVRVKVAWSNEPLRFRELSEGEQQLLTVLGLLKFTGGQDSLFLLDEPDTHLNPSWAVKYLEFVRRFIPDHRTSHMVMVTHHPLAIAELEKGQVQVMWRDPSYQIHASEPEQSPRGMGYGGILTSDMFGLRSTLDNPTEELLRERRSLVELDELTSAQKQRLSALDAQIEALGFSTAHWDRDYQQYLQARRAMDKELFEQESTPEVAAQRRARAQQIVMRIFKDREEGVGKK